MVVIFYFSFSHHLPRGTWREGGRVRHCGNGGKCSGGPIIVAEDSSKVEHEEWGNVRYAAMRYSLQKRCSDCVARSAWPGCGVRPHRRQLKEKREEKNEKKTMDIPGGFLFAFLNLCWSKIPNSWLLVHRKSEKDSTFDRASMQPIASRVRFAIFGMVLHTNQSQLEYSGWAVTPRPAIG